MSGSLIMTYSGRMVDPFNLWPSDITIEDIAHSLSMQCRFNGHCKAFYSVAEHSVHVSTLVARPYALWGLLHDASEAFICDIPTPLKRSAAFTAYREHEADIMRSVCIRFGLPNEMPDQVQWADEVMVATEARDLMSPHGTAWERLLYPPAEMVLTNPMSPTEAKDAFLTRFYWLTR